MAVKAPKKPAKKTKISSKAEKILAEIKTSVEQLEASGQLKKQKIVRYDQIVDGIYEDDIRPDWWDLPAPLRKVTESLTDVIEKASHRRLINLGKKPEQEHYSFKAYDEVTQCLANALCQHISRICNWHVGSAKVADFKPWRTKHKPVKKSRAKK